MIYACKLYKVESLLAQAVITMLMILTTLVEGQEKGDQFVSKLTELVSMPEHSLTEALSLFFTNKVLNSIQMDMECNTLKLIKSLLPHILYPAEEDLKSHLAEFPYQVDLI